MDALEAEAWDVGMGTMEMGTSMEVQEGMEAMDLDGDRGVAQDMAQDVVEVLAWEVEVMEAGMGTVSVVVLVGMVDPMDQGQEVVVTDMATAVAVVDTDHLTQDPDTEAIPMVQASDLADSATQD